MSEKLNQIMFADFLNKCGCDTGVDTEKLLKEELCMKDIDKSADEICESKVETEVRPFFLSDIMKALSELETDIWNNGPTDKVKMQNIVALIKSRLIQIDKEQKDIITVDGLLYRRVFE